MKSQGTWRNGSGDLQPYKKRSPDTSGLLTHAGGGLLVGKPGLKIENGTLKKGKHIGGFGRGMLQHAFIPLKRRATRDQDL